MKPWEVMKAFEEGAKIQIFNMHNEWDETSCPKWDWDHFTYRVAPKRWRPKKGDVIVTDGEVQSINRTIYKQDIFTKDTRPYIQDIQFIERDPNDITPFDWNGPVLLKFQDGSIRNCYSSSAVRWGHGEYQSDIVGWRPIGPIEEVRKVFFKNLGIEE